MNDLLTNVATYMEWKPMRSWRLWKGLEWSTSCFNGILGCVRSSWEDVLQQSFVSVRVGWMIWNVKINTIVYIYSWDFFCTVGWSTSTFHLVSLTKECFPNNQSFFSCDARKTSTYRLQWGFWIPRKSNKDHWRQSRVIDKNEVPYYREYCTCVTLEAVKSVRYLVVWIHRYSL